jgi:eukaryotic-like serine/threonine-protein kinase
MAGASSAEQSSISLGKYRLIAELGHGGMARVYLAIARGPVGFNKLLVIKQIDSKLAAEPEFLTMFLDEARLAARLSHANVVQTNEVGQEDDRYFIAMEYLEGQPLNRVISRIPRPEKLTRAMQIKIISEVLGGLHYAHELKDYDGTELQVVHRDISPHNVFVTYDGAVKVVDFGIAKAMSSTSETRTGVLKGKIAYMSPEQARGDRVDCRADLYSVGVMLWEVAASRRLWKGMSDVAILHKLISGDIPTPRSLDPSVPERLEQIVLKAMAQNRDDRYANALDLQADLDQYLEEQGEKVNLREIGKLVATTFEADRAKVRALIEAQMKEPREGEQVRLPTIEDPATSMSGSEVIGPRETSSPSAVRGPLSQSNPRVSGTAITASIGSLPEPAPQPAGGSNTRFAIAAAAGVALIIGVLALLKGGTPAPAAQLPTAAPSAEPAKGRTLRIESVPPGAAVYEGAAKLGVTPVSIPLDPSQVDHRVFAVTLDGYMPYAVNQGPSKEDVRIVAGLVPSARAIDATPPPKPSATAEKKADKPSRPRAPPPPPPAAPKPPPQSDIRMDR